MSYQNHSSDTPHLELDLVDAPQQADFDRLTQLTAALLKVPVALVSIVEESRDRQFFASQIGLPQPWATSRQTPLSHSFCQHVKARAAPLVVADARLDPLVALNGAVKDLDVIAYVGAPVFGLGGEPLGALCAIDSVPRDWTDEDVAHLESLAAIVTEQIRLRGLRLERNRAAEKAMRFGRIFETAAMAILLIDPSDFTVVEANAHACAALGFARDELTGRPVHALLDGWSEDMVRWRLRPLRDGQARFVEADVICRAAGDVTIPVALRIEAHQMETGPLLVAYGRDMRAMTSLRARLNSQRADFEALFQNAPDVMSFADMDGTLLEVNPAYEAFYGQPAEDLVGQTFWAQIPETQRGAVRARIADCTPERPHVSNVQSFEKDGEKRWFQWTNVVVFEEDAARRIISIGRDISDLKAAVTLAEEKAREAEAASVAQQAFLANMSHEIRTPLNGVIGLSEELAADLPAAQRETMQVISGAGRHLLSLLNEILDVAKFEAEGIDIRADVFSPRCMVDQTLRLLGQEAADKGLDLRGAVSIDAGLQVKGNEMRIRQVLTNLLSNAIKFTDAGTVTVRAEIDVLEGRNRLCLQVVDTGPGVPDAEKDKIFDRFRQGDHTAEKHLGGIGLGLAISKKICLQHGGDLSVSDTDGGGATFTAHFDVAEHAAVVDPAETDLGLARDLRLLVADDNKVNRMVIRSYLSRLPVEVSFAENGAEALAALEAGPFDGAFLDVRMPVMDGVECASRLRAMEAETGRLPLVACTANVMSEQIETYFAAGFDRYLPKPLNKPAFLKCLRWMAGQAQA